MRCSQAAPPSGLEFSQPVRYVVPTGAGLVHEIGPDAAALSNGASLPSSNCLKQSNRLPAYVLTCSQTDSHLDRDWLMLTGQR
jgi:hypothetical protein